MTDSGKALPAKNCRKSLERFSKASYNLRDDSCMRERILSGRGLDYENRIARVGIFSSQFSPR